MRSSTLIVMERGSPWPPQFAEGAQECVVVSEEHNDLPGSFLRRTCDCIRAVEQAGQLITLAVFGCSDKASRETLAERVALARVLLASVVPAKGRLVLVARPHAPASLQHSLLALAGALTESLKGTSASVSVVFGGNRKIATRQRDHELAANFQ